MAIPETPKKGNATKRIRTGYCWFCKEWVDKPTVVPIRGRIFCRLCPKCGGGLESSNIGQFRRIFTTR